MSEHVLQSYTLCHWAYYSSGEVLLLYSNSYSIITVFIHKSDFDRAFGNLVSLNFLQLITSYSYRFSDTSYIPV